MEFIEASQEVVLRELTRVRRSKGFSQRVLAREAGVSPSTVYELESGRRTANPSTLGKLAKALDVAIIDLLEESDRPKAVAPPSLDEWLEERCGHSCLAMSFDELGQFIRDAEDLDEQRERRQLLREEIDVVVEERKRFPATEQRNIGGVPFEEIHNRWVRTLFVSVELRTVTAEEAALEMRELATA